MTKKTERAGLALLLVSTAVLYLTNITVNGMANSFYSGSVWAGTRSWKALLFGSVDPSNFITVDKPPLSQWIMGLSGRLFGFSAASLLVPEALMGVATVWLAYLTVRRVASPLAALVSGFALALTPVAALMFRFDNPDAVMTLLMVAACYCTVRAAQKGSLWWLCLGGGALGLAFLAKMLEGVMSLPALVLLYLIAAPHGWVRKMIDVVLAGVTFVVAAGWYVVLTMLWPASDRPYLAGSTNNSFLNLAFGYNGLSRVQGRSRHGGSGGGFSRGAGAGSWTDGHLGSQSWAGASGRGAAGGAMGGRTGPFRLFSGEFALEISWLLPAALVALVGIVVLRRGRGREDLVRATAISLGVWLVSNGIVLSFMGGTTHAYYTLAIAAPIAMLVGLGVGEGWAQRETVAGRVVLAAVALTGVAWGVILWLAHDSSWLSPVPIALAVLALVAAAMVLLRSRGRSRLSLVALALSVVTLLGSPAAFAINVDTAAHTGSSPSVNPRGTATRMSAGRFDAAGAGAGGAAAGFMGRTSAKTDPAVTRLLRSSHARWAAAASTTAEASELELASRTSVMGIGGFSGSDPVPTLAQFQKLVAAHEIGYYVVSTSTRGAGDRGGRDAGGGSAGGGAWSQGETGSGMGASGGRMGARSGSRGSGTAIAAWVQAHFTAQKIGHTTVYDLSKQK